MNRTLIDRLLADGSLLCLEAAAELQRIAREHRRLPHAQTITIPREQWAGPEPVGFDATSLDALTYSGPIPVCECLTACQCKGSAGRSPTGAKCKGHMAPQLSEDAA